MKNEYRVEGDIVKIFFRKKDGYFLIDKDDFEKVSRYTWYLNQNGYAYSGSSIKAHHVVKGKPPEGMVTDHINRNRLDNRRNNLRHVTQQENNLNRNSRDRVNKNKMLGIKVYKGKRKTTYYVDLHDENNKTCHFGKFSSLEEAIEARDKAYKQIWERQ